MSVTPDQRKDQQLTLTIEQATRIAGLSDYSSILSAQFQQFAMNVLANDRTCVRDRSEEVIGDWADEFEQVVIGMRAFIRDVYQGDLLEGWDEDEIGEVDETNDEQTEAGKESGDE